MGYKIEINKRLYDSLADIVLLINSTMGEIGVPEGKKKALEKHLEDLTKIIEKITNII